jgi:hypothetical protein
MIRRAWARWVKMGGVVPTQGLHVVACTLDTGAAHRKSCLGLARFNRGSWTLLQVLVPDWTRWADARLTHWLAAWTPNSVDGPLVRRLGEPAPCGCAACCHDPEEVVEVVVKAGRAGMNLAGMKTAFEASKQPTT